MLTKTKLIFRDGFLAVQKLKVFTNIQIFKYNVRDLQLKFLILIGQLAGLEDKIGNLTRVIAKMSEEMKEIKEGIKDLKEIKDAQKSHIFLTVSIFLNL